MSRELTEITRVKISNENHIIITQKHQQWVYSRRIQMRTTAQLRQCIVEELERPHQCVIDNADNSDVNVFILVRLRRR